MIFTWKTRHKLTKHGEITSDSRDLGLLHVALCGNTIETPLHFTMIAYIYIYIYITYIYIFYIYI